MEPPVVAIAVWNFLFDLRFMELQIRGGDISGGSLTTLVIELSGSLGNGIRTVVKGKRVSVGVLKPLASTKLPAATLNLVAILVMLSCQFTEYVSKYLVPFVT
ncbi:hypothetical protein V8G54_037770 [Vigna mungo]|uniref:Uncharacterized protein n=1 Tax=Vigna mungo TaxID=3915 RepID=A0AAQ3MJT3_VIGMU